MRNVSREDRSSASSASSTSIHGSVAHEIEKFRAAAKSFRHSYSTTFAPAAVGCGAVCAGIRESILHEYIAWGTRVGECFQALDDLDDGDRSDADRVSIEDECKSVVSTMERLNERLAGGVTREVVTLIVEG